MTYKNIFKHLVFIINNEARVLGGIAFIITGVIAMIIAFKLFKKMLRNHKKGKEISLNMFIVSMILFSTSLAFLTFAVLMSPATSLIIIITILLSTVAVAIV